MPLLKRKRYSRRRPVWKRKTRGRYARRGLKRTINRILMRKTETKYLNGANENIQLYHNYGAAPASMNAIIFNPWASIAQGTGSTNRIGTEVYPRGMAVRLELFNKLDRPNIMYRIIVAIIPKIYAGAATNATFDFRDNTGSANSLLAWMKPDAGIKVLYDKVIRNEAHFSAIASGAVGDQDNKEAHKFVKFYIRSKRGQKLVWGPDGNLINKPMILYVIPYDSYGTLTTDNIASCAINTKFYFKDI